MSDERKPGWPYAESPFHPAELALQERFGARARLDTGARMGIRDYMPDQHRQFFAQLPFLVIGVADESGQPWATILQGEPGFVTSPSPTVLDVAAAPFAGDPAMAGLRHGADVGLLGIEPPTRRRNRMNGTISAVASAGFSVTVKQSYGNCPQYIQAREPHPRGSDAPVPSVTRSDRLSPADVALLARSDTFFIASAARTDNPLTSGVDVSHRGGKPGFIRVDDDAWLTTPDFRGNFFFNTLGNLMVEPRAGVVVIDYDGGGLLQLAVTAEIIWSGPQVEHFAGAQRLLRFRISQVARSTGTHQYSWSAPEFSPQVLRTGEWMMPPGVV